MNAQVDQVDALIPCPFCGDHAVVAKWTKNDVAHFTANCEGCDATATDCDDPYAAAEAWNQRAMPAAAAPCDEGMLAEVLRPKFEKWVIQRHGASTERWADTGEYKYGNARAWWDAWKEALRAKVAQQPAQPAQGGAA